MLFAFLAIISSEGFAGTPIRVGIYDNPPLVSMTTDGKASGLAVDILRAVASKANWELEYIPGTFQQGLDRLKQDKLDLFLAIAETENRSEFASFSKEPFVFNWGQVICYQGLQISSLPDLSGRVVAVLKGDIFYTGPNGITELTRKFGIDCRFLELDSYAQVVTAVAIGEADAGVVDRFFMFSRGLPHAIHITQAIFSPISGGVAAPRGKEHLLSRFDQELRLLKQGPRSAYDSIFSRWLTHPSTYHDFWQTYRIHFVVAFLVLLTLGIYTFFLLFLVQKKGRQTRHAYKKLSREIEIHRQTTKELLALSFLVEQAEEGVIILDRKERLLLSNPAAGRIFALDLSIQSGKFLAEVLGGETGFLDEILAETRSGHNWTGEAELQGDGESEHSMILNVSAFPVRGPEGEILFHGITMWDVTRERRMEEQIHQKQKLELVGQMAGGIAHEFNNLLTVISGSTELIDLKSREPQVKALAATVLRSSDRAAALVSQLLGFSRRQIRLPRPIDLKKELPGITEVLSRLIPEDITLAVEISPDLPVLEADLTQIHQILANLVTNARDAIRERPGSSVPSAISIRMHPMWLDESDGKRLEVVPGQYAAIEVSDYGTGIRKEVIGKIFEPFFTTKEVGKGSGLGLATVLGIARQNGGTITVSNRDEGGAVFTVFWPVPVEKPMIPEGKEEQAMSRTMLNKIAEKNGEVVLVVEDENSVLELTTDVLKEMGFKVWSAGNGREALLVLEEVPEVSILITDVIMPEMNGAELADKVRAMDRKVKIVFTSGYDREELSLHGIDVQSTILIKPYSIAELREVMLGLIKN